MLKLSFRKPIQPERVSEGALSGPVETIDNCKDHLRTCQLPKTSNLFRMQVYGLEETFPPLFSFSFHLYSFFHLLNMIIIAGLLFSKNEAVNGFIDTQLFVWIQMFLCCVFVQSGGGILNTLFGNEKHYFLPAYLF